MTNQADVLATVGTIEDNEDTLRLLIEQLKTSVGVIPFVGAGLSIPLGFAGWSSFLLAEAKKSDVEERIRQYLEAGEYEEAAEDLVAARGYRAFHDAISNAFGPHRLAGKQITGAVAYLPRLAAGPVITTNFDHVLEEAFKQAGSPFERVVWGVKADSATTALHQNRRFLLKIHGDAEESTDRVLTKSDYQKQYGSLDGSRTDFSLPLPRLLQQMLVGRPLLFLGCSLNSDRTVAVIDQVAQSFRAIAHYAVVEQPASRPQFYERSRYLSNHNIRPIWYPSGRHDLLAPLLVYLADTAAPSRPPARDPHPPAGPRATSSGPPPEPGTMSKKALRDVLLQSFNLAELAELCFDISERLRAAGIPERFDLEDIDGESKTTKVINLIGYLERRGYLPYLVAAIRQARAGIL